MIISYLCRPASLAALPGFGQYGNTTVLRGEALKMFGVFPNQINLEPSRRIGQLKKREFVD